VDNNQVQAVQNTAPATACWYLLPTVVVGGNALDRKKQVNSRQDLHWCGEEPEGCAISELYGVMSVPLGSHFCQGQYG